MAKDYSQLSKEELLLVVERLEARKKYGLIWDEEKTKEKFEKESENAFPVLKTVESKDVFDKDKNKPINVLIEGDNYHTLSVLNFTHQEKIDLIYIDPPYNTENKDFKYNDTFVDKTDVYRHSKWLSFMFKRLRLAKNLLKETGVIFISINEEELAHLKIICDEIFGENNYLANFTIKVRHEDRILKGDKDFHEVVENLLLYRKSDQFKTIKRKRDNTSIDDYVWEVTELTKKPKKIKCGNKEVLVFAPGQFSLEKKLADKGLFKKVNIRGSIKEGNSSGRFYMKYLDSLAEDQMGYLFKVPSMGSDEFDFRYFMTPESEKHANGNYFQGVPVNRSDIKEVPYPNFFDFEEEFNSVGYEGGVDFRNGKKPMEFLQKIFEIAGLEDNKDALVLDFFGGSGSTGHALLEYNEEYPGARKFILCTNNEADICTKICYPRLLNAIKGYKTKKGQSITPLGGSLKYFKTAFVKNSLAKDDMKIRLANECTEMLCLREGVFEEIKTTPDYKIFKQNDNTLALYYSLERDALKDLKKELDKLEGVKILYCFTLDPLGLSKSDFIGWSDVILEPIPQKILDVYKQIYEY